jgi:C-methyltransferase C-terminal domain/Putative zinc binding domain
VAERACRACRRRHGDLVLDLGEQPAGDYFPPAADSGPDPIYPLQMWLCASCGLAQLLEDPTLPEEARGAEPAALIAQATDAVERVAEVGWLQRGARVTEFASPHGGSWLANLVERGLKPVNGGEPADVVLDCFGLMHAADQAGALAARVARVDARGVLLLQYHPLDTIIRLGQWNALRHGHFAYYSTTALTAMLAAEGFSPRMAWDFDLYGGTVLLAACRDADAPGQPDGSVSALLQADARAGVRDPVAVRTLQDHVQTRAEALHEWLSAQQRAGRLIVGYGAASRAVALLLKAGVDRRLLPAVIDASPSKQGLRMPGTDIPIVGPSEITGHRYDAVLLFVPDLLPEVRAAYPAVEAAGGRWVDAEALGV